MTSRKGAGVRYLSRVLPYLRPYWVLALISVGATVLDAGANLLAPWPLQILLDNVIGQRPLAPLLAQPLGALAHDRLHLLLFAVAGGLCVTLLASGLNVLANYVNTKMEQHIVLDFRADLFAHTQRLGVAYHDSRNTGLLMLTINTEADAAGGLIMALQPIAQSALTLIGMFWVSFQIDHELALLSLTVLPFLYYSVGYYAKHIQQRLTYVKSLEGTAISIIHEALSMLRVIVAFGREPYEDQRYRSNGEGAVAARVGVTVRQTVFTMAVNMITATGTALILGVGAYHALEGRLTGGQLMVILTYIGSVYKPLESISYTIGSLQDRFVALAMAFGILDTPCDVQEAPHAATVDRVKGHVAFEGVGFSYPGRTATLHEISFEARAGQAVAIVGATGAGKTTLMSLLPRFYDPHSGRILLDGIDLRDLTLSSLREQISLVPQEPVLFSGTVADNIRYGRLGATMDEVIVAARDANAHDFIMRLPGGYETSIGERGAQLSGGERQRICVARAFLKDAPILILDEPTSSIDSKTEAAILDALDRLMAGRTTFMIAHRLSTIRHSDLIVVLNQGQLVEQGTHDELLQRGGQYRQLHDLQTQQTRRKARLASAMYEDSEDESTPPSPYSAEIAVHNAPASLPAGAHSALTVRVKNTSGAPWPQAGNGEGAAVMSLGNHWLDEHGALLVYDDGRAPLPRDVAPGEELDLTLGIKTPAAPGRYRLELDLVHEGVAWFAHQGSRATSFPVELCGNDDDATDDPAGPIDLARFRSA